MKSTQFPCINFFNFCDLLFSWVVVRKWCAMVIQMRRIRKTGMRQVKKEDQRTQNCCKVKTGL